MNTQNFYGNFFSSFHLQGIIGGVSKLRPAGFLNFDGG